MLTLAFQFLSSRPSTPNPFRPKRSGTGSLEVPGPGISGLAQSMNGAPSSAPDAVEKLEAVVKQNEGMQQVEGGANGKTS